MDVQAASIPPTRSLLERPGATPSLGLRRIAVALAATFLIALCAHISVPLPVTPVPITMQTFAVLLIGLFFGPFEAATVLSLYLAEGAVGLPVFSPHGIGGVAQLGGVSGGYLLSYPLAAFIASALFAWANRFRSVFFACLAAALVADAVIVFSGATWLCFWLRLSPLSALRVGALPFLAGDLLKVALVAILVTALRRVRTTIQD